jgi:hypothetical protein
MKYWAYNGDTEHPIADDANFIDANGTQYPGNYPKDEIAGMVELPPPPRILSNVLRAKLSDLAEYRWSKEVGGFDFNGAHVSTDDRDKLFIKTAYDEAKANASYSTSWKVAPGIYLNLDATALIALGDALLAHVSSCFSNEQTKALALVAIAEGEGTDAEKIAAVDAYDFTW